MILFPERKLAWVHVPKTGGTTICDAFVRAMGMEDVDVLDGSQSRFHERGMHAGFGKWSPPEGWRALMFVRDPWSRVWSGYHSMGRKEPFSEFVLADVWGQCGHNRVTYAPCSAFDPKGVATDVFRFEEYAEGVSAVYGRLGLEGPASHLNSRDYDAGGWRSAYTPEMAEVIRVVFAEDFERYGYDPGAV